MRVNRVRARERTALRAWAAQRAALDAWHRAELQLEEIRSRTLAASHAGPIAAGEAAVWSGASHMGASDSTHVHAEGARRQAARLARAEQQAAVLKRQAEAYQATYREALERMGRDGDAARPVESVAAVERTA
jgi:hypothetical protein